jgi:hypothetical protein
MRVRVVILAATFACFAAHVARAAVRVEADEVIFSLKAHDAKEVYLIGDFNQWNPTVEPMDHEGDDFVVRLFLVAGTYHYKFVVDGRTIVDPDNPGTVQDGSPLILVERSGGLILSTELPEETAHARTAGYRARYIGFLRVDEDDSDVEQRVDLGLHATLDRLDARAVVATGDSSWAWSPTTIDAFFDRGRVEVQTGKFAVRGFENDSTWASSDPTQLVGNAGLYRYDAGFRYHGVTGAAIGKHAALRARWTDETERLPRALALVTSAQTAPFVTGSASDTTVYAYTSTFNGSDNIAIEATADAGDFVAGYIVRQDAGLNPGLWVDIARRPTDFATQTYATREDHHLASAWLAWKGLRKTKLTFGYGWGDAEARAYATASGTSDLSAPLDATAATLPSDRTRDILSSDRFVVELEGNHRVATSLRWDYTHFDFDELEGGAEADVHRARVDASGVWSNVRLSASATYTNQKYRATPDALYIDWPERNVWLSRWDAMDVPSMVAVDLEEHTVWTLDAMRDVGRVSAGVSTLLQTLAVTDAAVHASVRAHADVTIHGPWYAYGDARWAWYDRAAWGVEDSFFDLYIEGGYRGSWLTLSAGFGLDPWAFDPVVSDFADLGRSEYLRDAIRGGVRRSEAAAIGNALIERERSLEDLRLFKLECVIELE